MTYEYGFGFGLSPIGRKLPRPESSSRDLKKKNFFDMLRLGPDRATLKIHLSCYMARISIGKGSLDRS